MAGPRRKVVLEDFNVKVGREGIFGPTVEQFRLHAKTASNDMIAIDFVAAHNTMVFGINFLHLDIYNITWMSPDRSTSNQIDHIVIHGRCVSSVPDVRTFTGPNIDSDWDKIFHCLQNTAETILSLERPTKRNQWYYEECSEATAAKQVEYRKTLQSAATRAIVENCGEKRREVRRLFRRKKRD